MFKCGNSACGKEFDKVEFIRCPYCGSKTLFKITAPVSHKIPAI